MSDQQVDHTAAIAGAMPRGYWTRNSTASLGMLRLRTPDPHTTGHWILYTIPVGPISRANLLDRVSTQGNWDIIVIGGGATGLGAAVDAASRGHRTLLLEAHDFAQGTSSRSTKLAHGGVRYLAQGNIGLVRGALHERGLLFRNAPHLVHSLRFIVPSYEWWSRSFYGTGLKLYDQLAGKYSLGPSRLMSRDEALQSIPILQQRGLRGGISYFDGQFDDARLAITLMRTLLDLGGTAINYMPVMGLLKRGGRVTGVSACDVERGTEFEISARAVVNATGVYADAVRRFDEPDAERLLSPSQGIHLVLDGRLLPGDSALMVPRTDDGRVLFAIPWLGRTLLGTTDTPVKSVSIEPRPLHEEVDFLLSHAARYFDEAPSESDILSIFAGLRPLVKRGEGKQGKSLSRDHSLLVSRSGLVTITGGKWTTYRRMGADAIDAASRVGQLHTRPSLTEGLKLHGWCEASAMPTGSHFSAYGSDLGALDRVLDEQPSWGRLLHPRLPYVVGEVVWAARYELARTVEDVLSRRTRSLLLDVRAGLEAAPRVAHILAAELGMGPGWEEAQVKAYADLVQAYMLPMPVFVNRKGIQGVVKKAEKQ